ncbi:MAG: S8 family serine peptidase [Bacteroidota bacterium]
MKNFLRIIIALSSVAIAQQLVVKTNGVTKNIPVQTMDITVTSIENAIVPAEIPTTPVRLIIELKAPSKIEKQLSGGTFSKTSAVAAKQQLSAVGSGATIGREFETVLNGFAVTTQRENIRTIASLPDVKTVFMDVTVNASPVSTSFSRSPIVPQSTLSVATGKGIRIGIIDTGIDYMHESLGGGFGAGFTVAGGYDFVNNDADPMDDNGHGTHVAGIISGNSSTISGAAKDAQLFAYKVLDQNGSGSASTVIAAIERAISDSVQILNLSFGSPDGSADDPLSSAVNRAVRAGIVVVVAAGNTGDYVSINSPGVADLALTVGAADGNTIASFSSKGPETERYTIKPDVVAPGVNILSAKNGGGYVLMSGTSMATPFVTGIAAAIMELHPNWSAIQIRDAIISNTVDLEKPLFSQGHGKVNYAELTSTVFSSPAQLSFGFNPPGESTWTEQRSINVYNESDVNKTYRFISTTTNAALNFQFTPATITIAPHSSGEIHVQLETNNALLSNNNSFENGYSGKLLAVGTSDSLVIPFAFIKAPILQLKFSEVPWLVMVHNGSNFSKTYSPKINMLSLILKDGTYNVVTCFYGSRYVINEGVNVGGKADVEISSLGAEYPVSFQPVDEHGEKIDLGMLKGTYSYLETIVHKSTGYAVVGMGGGKTTAHTNRPKYFSALSNNYSYGYSLTLQPNNLKSYTYDVIVDSGITAAAPVNFTASDMKHVQVKYTLASNVQRAFPITWTTFIGKYSSLGVTFYDGNADPMTFPFTQETFYTQRKVQFPIFHQREAYSF